MVVIICFYWPLRGRNQQEKQKRPKSTSEASDSRIATGHKCIEDSGATVSFRLVCVFTVSVHGATAAIAVHAAAALITIHTVVVAPAVLSATTENVVLSPAIAISVPFAAAAIGIYSATSTIAIRSAALAITTRNTAMIIATPQTRDPKATGSPSAIAPKVKEEDRYRESEP